MAFLARGDRCRYRRDCRSRSAWRRLLLPLLHYHRWYLLDGLSAPPFVPCRVPEVCDDKVQPGTHTAKAGAVLRGDPVELDESIDNGGVMDSPLLEWIEFGHPCVVDHRADSLSFPHEHMERFARAVLVENRATAVDRNWGTSVAAMRRASSASQWWTGKRVSYRMRLMMFVCS